MSSFHFVKRGILGIRTVHWFTLDWVQVGSIACLEVGPQRGFARETLGEPSTFKLWQSGRNTFDERFGKIFLKLEIHGEISNFNKTQQIIIFSSIKQIPRFVLIGKE
jgi:hypothetical protein